ncbi:MAG: redox-sensing transcriptional repressor Rex [Chloroflexi bacterium]|nr:redox-sensing transcriptional repressor Rex [Chloroflexota bacterium]
METRPSRRPRRNPGEVPDVVVERLPLYLRAISNLTKQGREVISSQDLGAELHTTPAQIRKDLSYFGRFGKQGRGYHAGRLLEELRHILQLDRTWNVTLVGVGRLGKAIISYPGFAPQGFRIVAAFDADSRQVGQLVGGLTVQPMSELERAVREKDVSIAIVAVPATQAQAVIQDLVKLGIRAILNYAPVTPRVPDSVRVKAIDPVLTLQSITYYLRPDGASLAGEEEQDERTPV